MAIFAETFAIVLAMFTSLARWERPTYIFTHHLFSTCFSARHFAFPMVLLPLLF